MRIVLTTPCSFCRQATLKPNKCSVHTYQIYLRLLSCHEVIKPFLEDCVFNCWQCATVCQERKTNLTSQVNLLSNCTSKPCLHNIIKISKKKEVWLFVFCHYGTINYISTASTVLFMWWYTVVFCIYWDIEVLSACTFLWGVF